MSALLEALRAAVGSDNVLTGHEVAARARNYWDPAPLEALAVVRPRNTQQVSAVLSICHARGQSVVPHGGRTGVCDGDRASTRDVVLALEAMNAIEEIDPIGRTAVVQAGCVLQSIQEAVERHGLYLPLDLGARGSCTIGGNVATNAGGINVIRYGMTRALVLGLEAVLADGTVVSSLNRMLKNNSGYDLKHLFIGSEGTLGVVTRVVLALEERPTSSNCALVALDEFADVVQLLKHMTRTLGGSLSAYEVMWGGFFRDVAAAQGGQPPLAVGHEYYVVLEAQGSDDELDAERFERSLAAALADGLVADAVMPKSQGERDRIWAIREGFGELLREQPVFMYDVGLPIAHMPDYVAELQRRLERQWPQNRCHVFGHIGDGNLHVFVAPRCEPLPQLHEAVDRAVYEPLVPFAGAISAEHGIGLEKKRWLPLSRSASEIALMRQLKRSLDPQNILNPGKVIDLRE